MTFVPLSGEFGSNKKFTFDDVQQRGSNEALSVLLNAGKMGMRTFLLDYDKAASSNVKALLSGGDPLVMAKQGCEVSRQREGWQGSWFLHFTAATLYAGKTVLKLQQQMGR